MSIIITGFRVSDRIYGPSDTTPYLADNRNSRPLIEVDFRVENFVLATTNDPDDGIILEKNPPIEKINTFPSIRHLYTNKTDGFADFKVGDELTLVNVAPNPTEVKTIVEIISTNLILVDSDFTGAGIMGATSVAYISDAISAAEFSFGLVDNDASISFISPVDGDTQRAAITGILNSNTAYQFAQLKGQKSWQFGSIEVKGDNAGTGGETGVSQAFTIKHNAIISPLMLVDQYDDIKAGIQTDEYIGGNSPKYVFEVRASTELNDPSQTLIAESSEILGNVGGFGENLNGGEPFYSVENLQYKRLDDTINTSLELTATETKIQFDLVNTENSPFSDGNTKFILGFNYAPADKAQYRDNALANSNTMDYNFLFDDVVSTLGAASGTPEKDGTDESIIKSLIVTFVDATRVSVEIRIEIASAALARIAANPTQRFMMYIETGNHTLTRANSDKEQTLIDANDFFIDNSDPTMFEINQYFLTHPFSDLDTEAVQFPDGRIVDDLLGFSNISFDKNTRETDEIIFTGVSGQLIARKSTGASFVLDSRTFELSNIKIIENATFGGIPNPNINTDRGFKTPADENRANIKFFRRYAEDSAGFFEYRFQYPFIIRWEDFVSLPTANDEMFDPDEANDGLNQNWIRIDTFSDWNIYFRTTLSATKNGNPLTYYSDSLVLTYDYDEGPEWSGNVLRTYDENDNLIASSGSPVVIKYADGRIEAEFNFVGATNPSISDLVIVLKIDVFEEGTFKGTYWLSSAYDAHPSTWWYSVDSSNRVVITNPSTNKFIGEDKLSGAKLPNKPQFKITPRIYDTRAAEPPGPPDVPKLMEDGTPKIMDGSTNFKLME
jgi:hypothetical protein